MHAILGKNLFFVSAKNCVVTKLVHKIKHYICTDIELVGERGYRNSFVFFKAT